MIHTKRTDMSGVKRSEALYHDHKDRQMRQEMVQKIVSKQTRIKQTKAVDLNKKNSKLAYQKLERDIDRAIQILLQAKYEHLKGVQAK